MSATPTTLPEQIATLTAQLTEANTKVGTLTASLGLAEASVTTLTASLKSEKEKNAAFAVAAEKAVIDRDSAKAELVTVKATLTTAEARAVELMAKVGQPTQVKVDSPAAGAVVSPVNDPNLKGLDRTIAIFAKKNAGQ